MKLEFTKTQLCLLNEVFLHQAPLSFELMQQLIIGKATKEEKLQICELINKEFCETGLDINLEPTERGLILEALLDIVNRPNIKDTN
jgi:hypothetical protein